MSFIQREMDRIGSALRQTQPGTRYAELYAAQQALVWVQHPVLYKSPSGMIGGFTDIPAVVRAGLDPKENPDSTPDVSTPLFRDPALGCAD